MAETESHGSGGTTVLLLLALGAGVLLVLKSKPAPRPPNPAEQAADLAVKVLDTPFAVGAALGDALGFGATDKGNKVANAIVNGPQGSSWEDAVGAVFHIGGSKPPPYAQATPFPPGSPHLTATDAALSQIRLGRF